MIILKRTRSDGIVIYQNLHTLKECGRAVAWCAGDNLGWNRALSAQASIESEEAFKDGRVYVLANYTFEIETTKT